MLDFPCFPILIPDFLNRVGSAEHEIVGIINEKVGLLVGLVAHGPS